MRVRDHDWRLLTLLFTGIIVFAASCKELEKNNLESTLQARAIALQNGNAEKYLEFFASYYTDIRLDAKAARKMVLERLHESHSQQVKIKNRSIEIEDDRARVTEEFFFQTRVKDQTMNYNETQHLLMEKRDERWVCIAGSEILWLMAGGAREKYEIEQVLLRRENALMHENIKIYMRLISSQYNHRGKDKEKLREEILHSFQIYDDINFKSFDRQIYFYGDYATVTQKYNMHGLQMGSSRTWSGQERLTLQKTGEGWKFIKGL